MFVLRITGSYVSSDVCREVPVWRVFWINVPYEMFEGISITADKKNVAADRVKERGKIGREKFHISTPLEKIFLFSSCSKKEIISKILAG